MTRFVDQVSIKVVAGNGGPGCLSFRREWCLPKGGPDGGDGGDGGSVILQVDSRVTSLVDLNFNKTFKAESGSSGSGKNKTGHNGADCIVKVPLGTVVYDNDSGQVLIDLSANDSFVCIAKGGEAGLGNARFKTSTNRAPRYTTKGGVGESRNLRLELKLMADVGLLGLPNAGKSSLIRAISKARPKVADYAFTTLKPHLGVVLLDAGRQFVVADIPGLVEGASSGAGLGDRFLRHLSRCKILLHMVSVYEADPGYDVIEAIEKIAKEIVLSKQDLEVKVRWIVLTKIDLIAADELKFIQDEISTKFDVNCIAISSINKYGLDRLKELVWQNMTD